MSGVTDTEDVSYVSSPWLPSNLRYTSKPMRSMAHRAHESAATVSLLKDDMSSAIMLSNVFLLVAEWIPSGHTSALAPNHTFFFVCVRAMCVCARLSR